MKPSVPATSPSPSTPRRGTRRRALALVALLVGLFVTIEALRVLAPHEVARGTASAAASSVARPAARRDLPDDRAEKWHADRSHEGTSPDAIH